MKYIKYIIPVLIIFLTIGFAATNVTLSITGDAYIASDLEDFEVYISSIKLDGVEDITLLKSSTEFVYTTNGGNGTTNIIEFAITNASTKFDADVNIECSDVDETLTITKTFDSSTYLSSMSSRSGTVKIYADGVTQNTANLTCTINATPIERTEYGEGEVPDKLIHNLKSNYLDSDASGSVTIGDEVVVNDEKFYIAYVSNDEVELIAQYNIGVNFRQSSETNYVTIMDDTSVLFTSGGAKNYSLLNNPGEALDLFLGYKNYLNSIIGFNYTDMYIPNYENLGAYGCLNMTNTSGTCNVESVPFLKNGQSFWSSTFYSTGVMYIDETGSSIASFTDKAGVRPVIKMTLDDLDNLINPPQEMLLNHVDADSSNSLSVGDVVNINGEEFYVTYFFSLTDSVELLAKYNIGPDFKQSEELYYVNIVEDSFSFSSTSRGDLTVNDYSSETSALLENYGNFFNKIDGFEYNELSIPNSENLSVYGCDLVQTDACVSDTAPYLVNGQNYWTTTYAGGYIFFVDEAGQYSSTGETGGTLAGIRPVLTMNSSYLEELLGY